MAITVETIYDFIYLECDEDLGDYDICTHSVKVARKSPKFQEVGRYYLGVPKGVI